MNKAGNRLAVKRLDEEQLASIKCSDYSGPRSM